MYKPHQNTDYDDETKWIANTVGWALVRASGTIDSIVSDRFGPITEPEPKGKGKILIISNLFKLCITFQNWEKLQVKVEFSCQNLGILQEKLNFLEFSLQLCV